MAFTRPLQASAAPDEPLDLYEFDWDYDGPYDYVTDFASVKGRGKRAEVCTPHPTTDGTPPFVIVPLNNSPLTVLIDATDFHLVRGRAWCKYDGASTSYAFTSARKGIGPRADMHRLIIGVADSHLWVDHIDGNGLNNRRHNLRIAVGGQNQAHRIRLQDRNTSGYAGVRKAAKSERWEAFIRWEGHRYFLGAYVDKQKAAEVRRAAEVMLFGEFAPTFTKGMDRLVGKYATLRDLVRGEHESKGSTGLRCVQHPYNQWIVVVRGVRLGAFSTAEEAVAVRDAYEAEHGIGFDHA
jgi:hypothetical protein